MVDDTLQKENFHWNLNSRNWQLLAYMQSTMYILTDDSSKTVINMFSHWDSSPQPEDDSAMEPIVVSQ